MRHTVHNVRAMTLELGAMMQNERAKEAFRARETAGCVCRAQRVWPGQSRTHRQEMKMRRLHPERFQMPNGGMRVPQAPLEAMGHSRTLETCLPRSQPYPRCQKLPGA